MLRRLSARPYRPPLPVICIGNLTAGGTGKTPLVGWLADRLAEKGKTPAILTMGIIMYAVFTTVRADVNAWMEPVKETMVSKDPTEPDENDIVTLR